MVHLLALMILTLMHQAAASPIEQPQYGMPVNYFPGQSTPAQAVLQTPSKPDNRMVSYTQPDPLATIPSYFSYFSPCGLIGFANRGVTCYFSYSSPCKTRLCVVKKKTRGVPCIRGTEIVHKDCAHNHILPPVKKLELLFILL